MMDFGKWEDISDEDVKEIFVNLFCNSKDKEANDFIRSLLINDK